MDLDATQALDSSQFDESDEEQEPERNRKLVGYLKVFAHQDLEEKNYEIFEGENFIGRSEGSDVYIPRKSLSKSHACIEVTDDLHLVYDNTSKNRTRRDKVVLKPQVRYELKTGDVLTIADLTCQYFKGDINQDDANDDDTGSDTGSESMLPLDSTTHDVQKDESSKVYAADTDSETDDEQGKGKGKGKAPVCYSSDEAAVESTLKHVGIPKDPPQTDDIKQYKPNIPNRMYDSSDEDEEMVKGTPARPKPYPVGHSTMIDASADSETLAFALISPSDQPVIRPTPKQIVEDTPATLLYTQDKSPIHDRSCTTPKDIIENTPATLLYGTETQDKSIHDTSCSTPKDIIENTPATLLYGTETQDKSIHDKSGTTPKDFNANIPATLLYSAETQDKSGSHAVDSPSKHNTPIDTSTVIYEPETQDFSPNDDLFLQPTQAHVRQPTKAYVQNIPSPTVAVWNIPDSEGEEVEEEDTEPNDSDVKKVLRFDDSATQAYSWNDSDDTDDEDLRFLPTQPYPANPATTEESSETDEFSNPDLYAPSTSHEEPKEPANNVDMQTKDHPNEVRSAALLPTLPYGNEEMETQAYDAESTSTDVAKAVEIEDKVEPTSQYGNAAMETQAYDAENEDDVSTGADTVNPTNKGNNVKPTLPYSMMETQAYDADACDEGETQDNDVAEDDIDKRQDVQQTVRYDLMETQAYDANACDEGETKDDDVAEDDIDKRQDVQQTVRYDLMETQAYDANACDEGETKDNDVAEVQEFAINKEKNNDLVIQETQAYGKEDDSETDDEASGNVNIGDQGSQEAAQIENQSENTDDKAVTDDMHEPTPACGLVELIPDSEQVLSQEIPLHEINESGDVTDNNMSDSTATEQKTDDSKISQNVEEITDEIQEEPELIIRPTRRGRGRVTQPAADENQSVVIQIEKQTTGRQRRGRSTLSTPATEGEPKVTRSKSRKTGKQKQYNEEDTQKTEEGSGELQNVSSVEITKSTRSSRSKKSKETKPELEKKEMEDSVHTEVDESSLNFSEAHTEKPMSTRGRRSRKTTKNVKAKDAEEMDQRANKEDAKEESEKTMTENTVGEASMSVHGRRSRKTTKDVHTTDVPCADETSTQETELAATVSKSSRGRRTTRKSKKDETLETLPPEEESKDEDSKEKKSLQGKQLKNIPNQQNIDKHESTADNKPFELKINVSLEKLDSSPIKSHEESLPQVHVEIPRALDVQDSEEDVFMSRKKGRGKRKGIPAKRAVVEDNFSEMDSEELPALEILLSDKKARQKCTNKDETTVDCTTEPQEPAVPKAVPSRRGRGRVTQSDDAIPAALSDASIAQLDNDDLMSPHSVAKSLSTRRGRGKNKTVAAETDTMEASSTSNTTNLSPAASESQSSTSSVTSKGRGKRTRTARSADITIKTEEVQATPAKRKKEKNMDDTVLHSPSLRERKQPMPKVMFTGVTDKQAEKTVLSLGGTLEESVYECTHLITDKVRRTVKFLCGVASGQIIVLPSWLTECKKNKTFIDPEPFFVHDKAAEKLHSFSLKQSHEQALKGGLLDEYKIHVTKNVKPDPLQMKDIILCAKGEYLPRMPCAMDNKVLVVSCDTDVDACKPALACGIPVYTAELLLTGILRQELALHENRLFLKTSPEEKPSAKNTGRKRRNDSVESELSQSTSRSSKRKKK